ncbi:MAG TPA: cobalamin-independent methionine synthase II family protein [Burkholderiales bacterium]|nr:cobalamin-independent methionine synthase II family protein [Burkholderiales bacterium]
MKASRERILTTHVGSLPRPPAVVDWLLKKERGEEVDAAQFEGAMRQGVQDIVRRQAEAGIDVVSDGETSKISYATYIKDRYAGFGGEHVPKTHLDLREHPEFRERMKAFLGPRHERRMKCTAPVALKDRAPLDQDLAHFGSALQAVPRTEGFMNAASPGVVAAFMPNAFYATHSAYIEALAEALKVEYEAIAAAGFVLQVDCPDLAMARHTGFQDLDDEAFLARAALHAEALNHALAGVPADRVRVHICWGNYEGPHDHDIELRRILPIVLKLKARAVSFEAANPRHEHEWVVWREARLPEDLILIPGVLDSCSNYVEHPELVAQRIERYAGIVGRERVLAGSDCGFGTFAGYGKVDGGIAFKKLRALAEGAALASKRLWKK